MSESMNDEEMRYLAQRLQNGCYGAGDDSQRDIERDQINALQERVDDLSKIIVELVGRLLGGDDKNP
jgi:hypothetical protein